MGAASIRTRPPSTVWALLTQWYGSWLKTRRVINDFTIGQTPVRICAADPSRVMLQITNSGGSSIAFGENRNITMTTGGLLPQNTMVSFDWATDLDLQTTEIWAVTIISTTTVHVVESLLVGEFETSADQ